MQIVWEEGSKKYDPSKMTVAEMSSRTKALFYEVHCAHSNLLFLPLGTEPATWANVFGIYFSLITCEK